MAVETCPEEYLEVSPFRHGVSLNPISFGPRYGVIVDDFEKAEISHFFKVVERKKGNYVKAAGKYACFYQDSSSVSGHDGSVIIKYSAKLDL